MLTVEELSQRFGSLPVLDGISFTARTGEFLSLVGPSGCGKTILLRAIVGLVEPSDGTVRAGGEIAYAFQKSPLFPWLSLEENVRLCVGRGSEEKIRSYFRAAGLAGFEHE